jgi:hypothetical protein
MVGIPPIFQSEERFEWCVRSKQERDLPVTADLNHYQASEWFHGILGVTRLQKF